MKTTACFVMLALLFMFGYLEGQAQTVRPKFLSRAIMQQTNRHIRVQANDPRPLDQAMTKISQHYGWLIDYEDPPWEAGDVVDDTDPAWRAAHPDAKGVTRVAGGLFIARFALGNDMSLGSTDEERVLTKVVDDYNLSGNPGQFIVRRENANRFSVIGLSATNSNSLLDTPITIPVAERTVDNTIDLVAQALSQKAGYKIQLGSGTAPIDLVVQTCSVGGEDRPAREILTEIADAPQTPLIWVLLFDEDLGTYFLNFNIAMVETSNGSQLLRRMHKR